MSQQFDQTILVADDDYEARDYFEAALHCQGFGVRLAVDGEDALRQLQNSETPASLVLLDVMLPGKNGVEILKEIRRMYGDLPVILVSSAVSWPYVVGQLGDSMTTILEKPVPHHLLIKAVCDVLDGASGLVPEQDLAATAQHRRRAGLIKNS